MTRILPVLALLSLALLAASLITGLNVGDLDGQMRAYNADQVERRLIDLRQRVFRTKQQANELQRLKQRQNELTATNQQADLHRLFGVAAALATVLVNSIVVTYFIGVSRWTKEVVAAYELDAELFARSARLKRQTFPWALAGMLAMIAVSALGAAGDPIVGLATESRRLWRELHLWVAVSSVVLVAVAYWRQWGRVSENQQIVLAIMDRVQAARRRRGLPIG